MVIASLTALMFLLEFCFAVAEVFVNGCQGIAMPSLHYGVRRWLPGCCYTIAEVFVGGC